MAISKKMTLSNIQNIHSKTFFQKKIIVSTEGKDFEVLIDEHFKGTKLQNLIMELAEKQKYLVDIQEVLSIPSFCIFLILKYFTNIQACQEAELFDDQIRVFNILLDLDLVDQIFTHWDKKELDKINTYVEKATQNIKELKNNPKAMAELANVIEKFTEYEETHNELLEVEANAALNVIGNIFDEDESEVESEEVTNE